MNKINHTYWLFYVSFLIVVCVAIFFEKSLLVYTKPIATIALIILYCKSVKKFSFLFPISMVIIVGVDVFTYIDFLKYFDVIAILITIFYILCILLLREFISKEDLKIDKLISPPAIIGILLISYILYSVVQLALPRVDNSIGYVMLIVVSMLTFSAFSFVIYVTDRFEKSIYLFIAASCTLFVDSLLAVNELYFYSRVFTVLINIAEILGIYFFASFFIETKPKHPNSEENSFF